MVERLGEIDVPDVDSLRGQEPTQIIERPVVVGVDLGQRHRYTQASERKGIGAEEATNVERSMLSSTVGQVRIEELYGSDVPSFGCLEVRGEVRSRGVEPEV